MVPSVDYTIIIPHYNIPELLVRCLKSIPARDDIQIIVIDDGSNERNKSILKEIEQTFPYIQFIYQENLGGAGGFFAGMKYMYEHHYEWLWMMDDDGLPASTQLEMLLKDKGEYLFLNALVVNKDDHSKLSFGEMNDISEFKGQLTTEEVFHPFNGTFIHWCVIHKVGLVKKEMFIWGDEQEYRLRVVKNGYKAATVISAIHYHPSEKGRKISVVPFLNNCYILDKPRNLSNIFYRNLGYVYKLYGSKWYTGLKTIGCYLLAYTLRFQFKEVWKILKYYNRGRNNNFNID